MNWSRLSEVSQAYGAVAAPFSAAAFLGAVFSIVYQVRQTRSMHEEIWSSLHRELMLRAIDDETLMQCWDPPVEPMTFMSARQLTYCNLIYRQWLADYVVGRMTPAAVRVTLEIHFRGEVARQHWKNGGDDWLAWARANANRRDLEFVKLTHAVYEEAVAGGPPVESASYFLPSGE
ncbi:DUF6082 family protein [Streptomyces sp. NPDC005648]|uniref:DUF6082 family protein n=1 Tax=Streptomyces sp. NPDC005648 TaxID=3157044 RepID=UPI0033AD6E90